MTRVLIVDDDCDHAESLADVIEMRGHTAQLAFSGEEAIDHFRASDFDFVLLDVKLPGINGVDTFLELKQIRPTAQVMMMTGYSVEQLVTRAIEGGALGVLHKPFAATEVRKAFVEVVNLGLSWDRALETGRIRAVVHDGIWFHLSTPPDLHEAEQVLEARITGAARWPWR